MSQYSKFSRSQNMKVIVAIVLALGTVSARGSGPYLPSGWKPAGPAFYLPGEVEKPADNPLKESIIIETEASGSDALREYGPPKVEDIAENIIQGLPDVVTEQTFYVQDAVGAVESEVKSEQLAEVQEATTEALEQVTEALEATTETKLAEIQLQEDTQEVQEQEVSTSSYEAEAKEEVVEKEEVQGEEELVEKEEIVATLAPVEERASAVEIEAEVSEEASIEKLEKIVEEEVKVVEEVKSIAESIVSLEEKAEQVVSVESEAQLKINEGSGSAQVPEGFLEYGPPGFREYGPPKGDGFSAAVVQESDAAFENNEARRRRFSPKLRVTKAKKHH